MLDVGNPIARRSAIPAHNMPRSRAWITAQYGDRMRMGVKVTGQDLADLSAAAGYDGIYDERSARGAEGGTL